MMGEVKVRNSGEILVDISSKSGGLKVPIIDHFLTKISRIFLMSKRCILSASKARVKLGSHFFFPNGGVGTGEGGIEEENGSE